MLLMVNGLLQWPCTVKRFFALLVSDYIYSSFTEFERIKTLCTIPMALFKTNYWAIDIYNSVILKWIRYSKKISYLCLQCLLNHWSSAIASTVAASFGLLIRWYAEMLLVSLLFISHMFYPAIKDFGAKLF